MPLDPFSEFINPFLKSIEEGAVISHREKIELNAQKVRWLSLINI